MSGPWKDYQPKSESAPWEDYSQKALDFMPPAGKENEAQDIMKNLQAQGMGSDDILKEMNKRYPADVPKKNPDSAPMDKIISDMGSLEKFLVGAGYGFEKARLGAMQLGAELLNKAGIASDETVQRLKQEHENNMHIMAPLKEQSTLAKVGEVVGEAAPAMLIPGGTGGKIATRLATGAIAGGVQGAIQPLGKEDSRASNIAAGAAMGGAMVPITSVIAKGFNAVSKPVQNELAKLSKKYGVRLTLGEITGNPHIQKAETLLEQAPIIGLKNYRINQHKEIETLGKNVLAEYMVDPNAADVMLANRTFTNKLYNNLNTIVKGIKVQEIQPKDTKIAAQKLLQTYPDIFKKFQDIKTETLLFNITEGVQDITKNIPASTILGANGNPLMPATTQTIKKALSFDELWTLRDGLGELIGQARKKIATGDVNKTQLAQLSSVHSAVNNDLDNWASSIGRPDIRKAITIANDAYKKHVVKFDIIERAYAKASGENSASEMFSPKKFSTEIKKILYKQKKLGSNLFTKKEIDELSGVANIMQAAKRSGQFMENPPTGNRWGLPVIAAELGGYLLHGQPGAAATAGTIGAGAGLARWLTSTESGKRFALAASKVANDSIEMKYIIRAMQRNITQFGLKEANTKKEK